MAENNANAGNAGANRHVTTAEFAAKFKTKREIFRWLTHDLGLYCPPFDVVTVWHLRDLAACKRRRIKNVEVDIAEVPFFEGLTVPNMLEWASQWRNGRIMEYLPSADGEIM
jgi:hypothetical protein